MRERGNLSPYSQSKVNTLPYIMNNRINTPIKFESPGESVTKVANPKQEADDKTMTSSKYVLKFTQQKVIEEFVPLEESSLIFYRRDHLIEG